MANRLQALESCSASVQPVAPGALAWWVGWEEIGSGWVRQSVRYLLRYPQLHCCCFQCRSLTAWAGERNKCGGEQPPVIWERALLVSFTAGGNRRTFPDCQCAATVWVHKQVLPLTVQSSQGAAVHIVSDRGLLLPLTESRRTLPSDSRTPRTIRRFLSATEASPVDISDALARRLLVAT